MVAIYVGDVLRFKSRRVLRRVRDTLVQEVGSD